MIDTLLISSNRYPRAPFITSAAPTSSLDLDIDPTNVAPLFFFSSTMFDYPFTGCCWVHAANDDTSIPSTCPCHLAPGMSRSVLSFLVPLRPLSRDAFTTISRSKLTATSSATIHFTASSVSKALLLRPCPLRGRSLSSPLRLQPATRHGTRMLVSRGVEEDFGFRMRHGLGPLGTGRR